MRIWGSGSGFDFDIVSEVLDAAHQAHGGAGLVVAGEVLWSEVVVEGAQHIRAIGTRPNVLTRPPQLIGRGAFAPEIRDVPHIK